MLMLAPYPLWLLVFFGTPVILILLVAREQLLKYWQSLLTTISICIVVGSLWDLFAVRTGVWNWPANCCVLPRAYGIPLEELIFMIFGALYIATLTILVRDIIRAHHLGTKRKRQQWHA